MSKNLPDNLFETPNTPIKEFFEEIDPGARYSDEAVALFAIAVELQTLNNTLKELKEAHVSLTDEIFYNGIRVKSN